MKDHRSIGPGVVLRVPMLFLQGTRDALAAMQLLVPLVERLGDTVATHSFHVPARFGRTDMQVPAELLDAAAAWIEAVARCKRG